MKNIEVKIDKDKMTIVVDLKKRNGTSKSGKNAIIATTSGNASVPGREDIKFGLNVYTPAAE